MFICLKLKFSIVCYSLLNILAFWGFLKLDVFFALQAWFLQ